MLYKTEVYLHSEVLPTYAQEEPSAVAGDKGPEMTNPPFRPTASSTVKSSKKTNYGCYMNDNL